MVESNAVTKNPHAVALGRLGGAKGGRARARALTAGRRREIARQAAAARTRSLSAQERRELARRAAQARWSTATAAAPTVRSWLRDLGAPLTRAVVANRRAPVPEQVVVEGLRLAHTDASVARALPVMLWANRDKLRLTKFALDPLDGGRSREAVQAVESGRRGALIARR